MSGLDPDDRRTRIAAVLTVRELPETVKRSRNIRLEPEVVM